MRSMTGFGVAAGCWPEVEISVELRTVNSRYLDLRFRLPKEAQNLEPLLRDRIQAALSRGRVELGLDLVMRSNTPWRLNEPLLRSYQEAANRAAELGVRGELTIDQVLQLPGILQPGEIELSPEELEARLLQVIDQALAQLLESRCREGEVLCRDLNQRLARLSGLLTRISGLAGDLTAVYRERLGKKIASLRQENSIDEGRLAQEVCYYAERSDITEELTRLMAHVGRFRDLLSNSGENQLGRNLDFLCQEMNREINTIASKAAKAAISELAVDGKVEIEKIREQVQNIE